MEPVPPGERPTNHLVCSMLTDVYQITMVYALWKAGRVNDSAVFDAFFRQNPFKGEFTVFAGLEEALKFISSWGFTPEQIAYLRATVIPHAEAEFWEYLGSLDTTGVRVFAAAEGTIVFPREPLLRVEGPLAVCQLLETTLLNLLNFASLVATNAARFRLAAGPKKTLIEFGLRRAQGPDGAHSASRYAYMGGFDGTSNVAAAMAYGIAPMGTHAHSFVSAFVGPEDLSTNMLDGSDLLGAALNFRRELNFGMSSIGELTAFVAYAQAFPQRFLALVDTYDTLSSGIPNFICVALALRSKGYAALGVRLDSGDLAYLSKEARRMMREVDEHCGSNLATTCTITASNDLNEAVLLSLADQGHEIDAFGVGTNLVTCQAQPALGMVYKLVELDGVPRIKLSNDVGKLTIPGAKETFRLIGAEGVPLLDVLIRVGELRPSVGKRMLCRHPFDETKRVYVTPSAVIPLLRLVWCGAAAEAPDATDANIGKESGESNAPVRVNMRVPLPTLTELRDFVRAQLALLREDHLRPLNATPYKVSVSSELFHYLHEALVKELPIKELE